MESNVASRENSGLNSETTITKVVYKEPWEDKIKRFLTYAGIAGIAVVAYLMHTLTQEISNLGSWS
tara:strand:+ start:321 stop:518 length:198 start_codon:yes stop_codon:yes gene_type:complete